MDLEALSPAEQVAAQVFFIERSLDEAMASVDPSCTIEVGYEALCRRPNDLVNGVATHLEALGAGVSIVGSAPTTAPIAADVTDADFAEVVRALRRLSVE
jgi:hypothetical protein